MEMRNDAGASCIASLRFVDLGFTFSLAGSLHLSHFIHVLLFSTHFKCISSGGVTHSPNKAGRMETKENR